MGREGDDGWGGGLCVKVDKLLGLVAFVKVRYVFFKSILLKGHKLYNWYTKEWKIMFLQDFS